jgi:hypothetical protein
VRGLDQSPPRTLYAKDAPAYRNKTFFDLQFVPSTVLNIKFDDDLFNGMMGLWLPVSRSVFPCPLSFR